LTKIHNLVREQCLLESSLYICNVNKMNQINIKINNDWDTILKDVFQEDYFKQLMEFVANERKLYNIYPSEKEVFNSLKLSSFSKTNVVIIGQDPYHRKGQAHGLSFSVPKGVKHPPSLRNIFKELAADVGIQTPQSGDLTKLAKQGVLLLNATLTVREKKADSHAKIGWGKFTNTIISEISNKKKDVIFLLWGRSAQEKAKLIDVNKHFVLKAPHPSPFSAYSGFFGSKHFTKTNNFLIKKNKKPIDWNLCSNTLTLF